MRWIFQWYSEANEQYLLFEEQYGGVADSKDQVKTNQVTVTRVYVL